MVMLLINHLKTQPSLNQLTFEMLVEMKAFEMVASKVDKLSGDLRVCLAIVRKAIENKLEILKALPKDTN
jgi:hypothetical protein